MSYQRNSEARQLAVDLATLAYDLASERMTMVFRRYGVEAKLFNPNQPRVPAKQHGAGQWTKAPSSGAVTSAVRTGVRLAGALAAAPEAAPAAGAALLPGMIGGIAISRAAGLNAVVEGGGASQGMGMTPILGLPFKIPLTPTDPSMAEGLTPAQRIAVVDQCEPGYDDMIADCNKLKSPRARAICYAQASDWFADCIRRGKAAIFRSSSNH